MNQRAERIAELDASIERTRTAIKEQEDRVNRKRGENREISEEILRSLVSSLDSLQYLRRVLLMTPQLPGWR